MQRTRIEWADYTWNPVVGCRRNCHYCYAKRINDRFQFIPDFNRPIFFPERLEEPYKLKKPSTIFVCSMGELFSRWEGSDIPLQSIPRTINVAEENPQHKFMFLTKNPKRMSDFIFPENAWVGITIENQKAADARMKYFKPKAEHKFISFEPLHGPIETDLRDIDLVIIGAQTNPFIKPSLKWIEQLVDQAMMANCSIFLKDNISEVAQSVGGIVKIYNDTKKLAGGRERSNEN